MSDVKRYRLLAKAEIDGAVREPGYIFTLAEGQVGPHRTVLASSHGAQLVDHLQQSQDLADVPLYEEIVEAAPAPEAAVEPTADEIKSAFDAAQARVATLERELADKHDELAKASAALADIKATVNAHSAA